MNRVVITFYKDIFDFVEVCCSLDSNSEVDHSCNSSFYQESMHPLNNSQSSGTFMGYVLQDTNPTWHYGTTFNKDDAVLCATETYGIDFESSVTEMDDNCNFVVPESKVQLR